MSLSKTPEVSSTVLSTVTRCVDEQMAVKQKIGDARHNINSRMNNKLDIELTESILLELEIGVTSVLDILTSLLKDITSNEEISDAQEVELDHEGLHLLSDADTGVHQELDENEVSADQDLKNDTPVEPDIATDQNEVLVEPEVVLDGNKVPTDLELHKSQACLEPEVGIDDSQDCTEPEHVIDEREVSVGPDLDKTDDSLDPDIVMEGYGVSLRDHDEVVVITERTDMKEEARPVPCTAAQSSKHKPGNDSWKQNPAGGRKRKRSITVLSDLRSMDSLQTNVNESTSNEISILSEEPTCREIQEIRKLDSNQNHEEPPMVLDDETSSKNSKPSFGLRIKNMSELIGTPQDMLKIETKENVDTNNINKKRHRNAEDFKAVNMKFMCPLCPLEKDRHNMRCHLLSHFYTNFHSVLPRTKPFRCPDCLKDSRDFITMTRHYAFKHNKIDGVIGCKFQDLLDSAFAVAHKEHDLTGMEITISESSQTYEKMDEPAELDQQYQPTEVDLPDELSKVDLPGEPTEVDLPDEPSELDQSDEPFINPMSFVQTVLEVDHAAEEPNDPPEQMLKLKSPSKLLRTTTIKTT